MIAMSSKFATVMVQFVPAAFVIGAGMELFMLNTVSTESIMSKRLVWHLSCCALVSFEHP